MAPLTYLRGSNAGSTSEQKDYWNAYIGDIWARVLQSLDFKKDGVIVEVAPGGTDKIGRGLRQIGWAGTMYVVEPHKDSLEKTCAAYSVLLPDATIHPVMATLENASLPQRYDAIVANHPLDDMIIGTTLKGDDFAEFFTDHYASPPSKTTLFWNKKRPFLSSALDRTVDAWSAVIPRAKLTVIAQYKSEFFSANGITEPDYFAYKALRRLSARFNGTTPSPTNGIQDKERWLVITDVAR